ncbi:hypothetical protein FRC05_003130 [Tulasnella sp. 425]|nr:hypothetical protein FRC05_003130 [Tulasnella sp. 425]
MDLMPITTLTPVSKQHPGLEGITNPGRNEVYGIGSPKWASALPDCLSLIFEAGLGCVLPWNEFFTELVVTDDSNLCQYLLTITQICQWWRQVALDTPRLWNILILNERASLSKLQTWLDRSKAAPLHIYLIQGFRVPSVSVDNELIPLLLQHVNRWGWFNYQSPSPRGLAKLLEALEGEEVPLLEKLSLSGSTHPREFESQTKLFNGPQSVPKLVDVKLWDIPLDWRNSPFRNLRALSLASRQLRQNVDTVNLEQFLALLQESPQLMRLELAWRPFRSDEVTAVFNRSGQTPKPVSLPSLTVLLIRNHDAPDILTLTLRLIHTPNLEELRLAYLDRTEAGGLNVDFSSTIEALGNGVLSSFEHLETLSLFQVSFRSKAAWYLFCSKLTHVRVINLSLMDYGPTDPEEDGDTYDCLLSAFLPQEDQSDLAPASDATTAVWKAITQVCRWWRQVAVETPRLWRILILHERTPLSKLQTWLDRSKSAPLWINLTQSLGELESFTCINTQRLPLLLQHINRWGRFTHYAEYNRTLKTLLESLAGKEAPLLEKLLIGRGFWSGSPTQAVSTLFNGPQSVPRLVDVDLWYIPLNWSISHFRNLRTLSLASVPAESARLEQFMAILQESPQLMNLRLNGSPVRSDELTAVFDRSHQTPQPVSLPSLADLCISNPPGPNILTLTLRLIHAPNLEKLQVGHLTEDERGSSIDFSSVIEALGNGVLSSFERLETLSLNEVSFRSKAAWYLLCSKLTHVRNMKLEDMANGPRDPEEDGDAFDCLLSAFIPHKDQSDLAPGPDATTAAAWKVRCPNLQKLFMHEWNRERVEELAQKRPGIEYEIVEKWMF